MNLECKLAKLISQVGNEGDEINLAVILSGESQPATSASLLSYDDMTLIGMKSLAEKEYPINFVTTLYRSSELLGAEDITRNILTDYKDIDVIFCTNSKDTVAAARVLIERNLVGQVYIVGTDINEEIISFINKDIIYGVLNRNGYAAGYKSVEVLSNNLQEEFQSNYVDIDIDIYTKIEYS